MQLPPKTRQIARTLFGLVFVGEIRLTSLLCKTSPVFSKTTENCSGLSCFSSESASFVDENSLASDCVAWRSVNWTQKAAPQTCPKCGAT